jgi:lambda repressor-like predicted transcriptional regulator
MNKLYAERDIIEQGDYYSRHTSAMTGEDLHSKSDIAAELAHRDIEIDKLKARVAAQQSALNSICTCSWGAAEFFDVGKAASWMQKIAYDALDEVPSTEAFILRKQGAAVESEIVNLCSELRKSGYSGISVKELLHESISRSSRIINEAKKFDDQ